MSVGRRIRVGGLALALGSLSCSGESESGSAPDFSAPDRNPASPSFGEDVSPRDHLGHVSGWFFVHSTCGYCRGQVVHLDALEDELDASHPELGIRLLLVNEFGYEAGEAALLPLTDLPYLQDSEDSSGAWAAWHAVFRDVVILDAENRRAGVFNLTEYDLGDPGYYAALRGMLLAAAGAE